MTQYPWLFVVSAVLYRHGFAKRIELADSEPEQLDLATLTQAQDAEIDRRVAAGLDFRYNASMMQLVTCQMLPSHHVASWPAGSSHRVVTIDPPSSKDLDDGISVRRLDATTLELGACVCV